MGAAQSTVSALNLPTLASPKTMQCSPVQCSAVQCSSVQCSINYRCFFRMIWVLQFLPVTLVIEIMLGFGFQIICRRA
jgi:hypothetical protein